MGLILDFDTYTVGGLEEENYSITCPTGTRLIGGGGGHRDNLAVQNNILLNYNGPDPANPGTTWRLNVTNTSVNSRVVRVYCICARMTN